jgi:hypothetical protein
MLRRLLATRVATGEAEERPAPRRLGTDEIKRLVRAENLTWTRDTLAALHEEHSRGDFYRKWSRQFTEGQKRAENTPWPQWLQAVVPGEEEEKTYTLAQMVASVPD